MLSIRIGFVLWHLPVVGPLGRGQCLASCVGGCNKWQKPEWSRIVSRIVEAQWRHRCGSAEPLSTMGKDSCAVACRNRDEARDGQNLVMEKQAGGRAGWEMGGKTKRVKSGWFLQNPPHALHITSEGLGPCGKSLFLLSLGLSFPT